MFRRLMLPVIAAVLLTGAAAAQTNGQRIIIERSSNAPRQDGFVRVQASINLFIPGATGDTDEATRNRDRARRIVYDMAGKECDLLREVLVNDCRLDSVSSNLHRQVGQAQEGYTVTGQMTLQITLK